MKVYRRKSKGARRSLLLEQKEKCNNCGKKLLDGGYCLDHIKPLGFGGDDTYDNMQLLCIECHMKKTKKENYCK